MSTRTLLNGLLLAVALLWPAANAASQTFGDYQLHYNALPSGLLPDEVARANGVLRSRARGVLLVSVQHEGKSVSANVRVNALGADHRPVAVELRRIRNAETVSYLGTFPIRDGESIRFQLEVTPEGSGETLHAGFSRQFFVD